MTKAEELLKNKVHGVPSENGTYEIVEYTDVVSAMEEQSIRFAEFLQNKCHYTGAGEYFYLKTHKEHTTSELYKLFNEL